MTMSLHKITMVDPATTLVVTPDEVRRHSLISGEDEFIESLIDAAVAMINGPDGIGISIIPAGWAMDVDDATSPIFVKLAPMLSVESIEWIDTDGSPQSSTELRATKHSSPAKVYHKLNIKAEPGSIVLKFRAGYETVPADLKAAVLMLVSHLYENREATTAVKLEEVPWGVRSILERYKIS